MFGCRSLRNIRSSLAMDTRSRLFSSVAMLAFNAIWAPWYEPIMTTPKLPEPNILCGYAFTSLGAINQCSLKPNAAICFRRALISTGSRPSKPSNICPVKFVEGALLGLEVKSASRLFEALGTDSNSERDNLNSACTRSDLSRTTLANAARSCISDLRLPKDAAMVSAEIMNQFNRTEDKCMRLPTNKAKAPYPRMVVNCTGNSKNHRTGIAM
mmetsp:Transcript_85328/g.217443  ORF Transcript_85328/g.217443 Transcript_85328/m.217443 type:complete len:213 (-) Transcript_85328:548-1186(-)